MSITKEMWESAILAAVVSGFFAASFSVASRLFNKIRSLAAIRRLLGPFSENDQICAVFTKEMYSRDGKYFSQSPNYFPPHTEGKEDKWINIPYVISTADMKAATDVLHLLGQAEKKQNIEFRSAITDWDLWNCHIIAVGGSPKSKAIMSSCAPQLIRITQGQHTIGFQLTGCEEIFEAINNNDYGIILKAEYPPTGKQCMIIMGLGSLGTEGASYYLRQNAQILGRAFGAKSFVVLVHCRVDQGKQSTKIHRWYPQIPLWRILLHPSLWSIFRRIDSSRTNG